MSTSSSHHSVRIHQKYHLQVLEVVVAMEQLGDIDVNNKGTLDLGEIFKDSGLENNGDFAEKFKDWADKIYK